MFRIATAAILAISFAAAPAAFARPTKQLRPAAAASEAAPAQSLGAITTRLERDGFRVLEIERDSRSYDVEAFDRDGRCVELRVDARTGDVLRREWEDDCDDHGRNRR